MKILVLLKEVPDTYDPRFLNSETGLADRAASEPSLDEVAERALESALVFADAHPDTEIVLLTMGPAGATTRIRKGLSMGATGAIHVCDSNLAGADILVTAEVLAAAARRAGFDLILAGNVSTDGNAGAIPAMLAELLGIPQLTNMESVSITAAEVSGVRTTEDGTVELSANLPALVSVNEAVPEARFPTFKGIMAAKKKPIEVVTLAELGISLTGDSQAQSILLSVVPRPPRVSGNKIVDEGQAAQAVAEFLSTAGLI